jgi:hypothetical protein
VVNVLLKRHIRRRQEKRTNKPLFMIPLVCKEAGAIRTQMMNISILSFDQCWENYLDNDLRLLFIVYYIKHIFLNFILLGKSVKNNFLFSMMA